MFISREAFLDDKYILLSPEVPISQELIARLQKWNINSIITSGDITDTPPSNFVSGVEAGSAPLAAVEEGRKDARELIEIQKRYREYLQFAERLFSNFLTTGDLPMNPIHEQIKKMMEMLKEKKIFLLRLGEFQSGNTSYVVDHSVKSTIMALAAGQTMKMPPYRLIDLGTVALLHEIGMVRLPSQLYMTNRELTEKERKAITTHTVLGFKILRQLSYPMSVCLGVLECRENMDGTGYPRGLTGEKLSVNAKIVNVCSAYAAMVSARPYRPALDGHTIMLTLLKGRGIRYDEDVLRSLVATLSLFPYGTYVELSNGNRAVVVEIDPSKPRNPKVRIITDSTGSMMNDQPVVETESEQYQIKGVLSVEDISRIRQAL